MASEEEAKRIKDKYGGELSRRPGVFAISLQRAAPGHFVLHVFVDRSAPLPEPEQIEEVDVIFEHQDRLRP
ncbi:hypothetical protein RZS28_17330 [Methylocapsa polymorpha]|uniref:Uncharacterized protein n=1 Tax=Methylocapsa polymorpha TaxID=3080828 RepID=A0ABZ0HT09_9HYPH|nr:hypothetical protein RZS28_17330 [Methylocapsa sp. RX1]